MDTHILKLKCLITEAKRVIGEMNELCMRMHMYLASSDPDPARAAKFAEEFDTYSCKMNTITQEYEELYGT